MAVALFLPVWEESGPCIQPLGVGWLLLYSYLCGKNLALVYSPWVKDGCCSFPTCVGRVWSMYPDPGCRMAVALFLPVWVEIAPCIQFLGVKWLLKYSYLCRKSLALVTAPGCRMTDALFLPVWV
jgi:hypothetical protein